MNTMSGDFIGFTYKGFHSSDLNIIRTSDGSRYNNELSPPIQDQTVAVPGGHGAYLFGSTFGAKVFAIPIAFDNISESDFYNLKVIFSDQKGGELIFDEEPYKVYFVKPSQPPSFSYICFDKEPGLRVYKGEGVINLIAYTPFARSRYKYRENYSYETIPEWRINDNYNMGEWLEASGLRYKNNLDTYINNKFELWNPGVQEADFLLRIPFKNKKIDPIVLSIIGDSERVIRFDEMEQDKVVGSEKDVAIQINTKLNLVEGIDSSGDITGSVYNKYHIRGNFFKIPFLESEMSLTTDITSIGFDEATLIYDYIYY